MAKWNHAWLLMGLVLAGCSERAAYANRCDAALSGLYNDSQRPDRAAAVLEHLKKFEKACRGLGDFEYMSASAHLALGDLPQAQAWTNAGRQVPGYDPLGFYETQFAINLQRNDNEKNKVLAEEVLRSRPRSAAGYYLLGKYYGESGDLSEAANYFEKARVLHGDREGFRSSKFLVQIYWNLSRDREAAAAFDAAEKIAPDLVYTDLRVAETGADAHFSTGSPERSREIIEKLLQISPERANDRFVQKRMSDLAGMGLPVTAP